MVQTHLIPVTRTNSRSCNIPPKLQISQSNLKLLNHSDLTSYTLNKSNNFKANHIQILQGITVEFNAA